MAPQTSNIAKSTLKQLGTSFPLVGFHSTGRDMLTAKKEKPLVALPSIRQHIPQYLTSWQAVPIGVIMVELLRDKQPF